MNVKYLEHRRSRLAEVSQWPRAEAAGTTALRARPAIRLAFVGWPRDPNGRFASPVAHLVSPVVHSGTWYLGSPNEPQIAGILGSRPVPARICCQGQPVEDAELLDRIADGDQRAIETLYQRFGGGMYAVALRVSRSERLAQEAVQDAFMAVWQDPGRYDPDRGSLGPWLLTLARYKAIDGVRREAAAKRQTQEVDLELYEAPDDVHDEVWKSLQRDRLNRAIASLPDDQRRALTLAFVEGLTHVEVAAREGVPLGTAKTRIRTALLRLRTQMAPEMSDGAIRDATLREQRSTMSASTTPPPEEWT
jgi:RNA polymerase sigma factor (sigma-70 family)